MTRWKHKVDVSDVFHNDELTLSEVAQTISARLARFTGDDDTMLDEMLEELCDAGHEGDVRWFDNVWSGIYDWADDERVWINTLVRTRPADERLTSTAESVEGASDE